MATGTTITEVFFRAQMLDWPALQIGSRVYAAGEESWRAIVAGMLPGEVGSFMAALGHVASAAERGARVDAGIAAMDAAREQRGMLDADDEGDAAVIAESRARLAELQADAERAAAPATREQADRIIELLGELTKARS